MTAVEIRRYSKKKKKMKERQVGRMHPIDAGNWLREYARVLCDWISLSSVDMMGCGTVVAGLDVWQESEPSGERGWELTFAGTNCPILLFQGCPRGSGWKRRSAGRFVGVFAGAGSVSGSNRLGSRVRRPVVVNLVEVVVVWR
jgi:hypothetical protein